VLVTGADGFIGSHLTEGLLEAGAEVRAFCYYNSNGSRGWLDHLEPGVSRMPEIHFGDVRDARGVEAACEGIEVVFHLAALVSIPYSYLAPESFVETNVRGTLNVLEAVRRQKVARLVHTSTSEVRQEPHPTSDAVKAATKAIRVECEERFMTSISIIRREPPLVQPTTAVLKRTAA
jgi:nucleoside-diphosphate-sugar epimerase